MDERGRLNSLLKRHGLRTTKGLGQHFLVDEETLHAIAHALDPDQNCDVVEIGSGAGNLALMLALSGAKVTGLEVDRKFQPLHHEIQLTNSSLTHPISFSYMDALDFNYAAEAQKSISSGRRFLIAGNIPYQITSPLIMGILESGARFDCMVLMMQKEVAERLATPPGSRKNGSITIKVQHYCEVESILDVPPDAFLPPPEVDSRVVRFRLRTLPPGSPARPDFFKTVDAAFMHRRKTVPNAIAGSGLHYTREQVEAALARINLSRSVRAEQLGVHEYMALHEQLNQ